MEKINIGELLKNCPTGMELDCTICDNVCLDEVTPNMIKCFVKNDVYNTIYFHHDGTYLPNPNAKCVIFPKGKTTWEGFQRPFKDGDIVVAEDAKSFQMFILKEVTSHENDSYDGWCYFGWDFDDNELFHEGIWGFNRLATREEKERLFKTLNDNDYRWNSEAKTLEKLIEPKFKVEDKIDLAMEEKTFNVMQGWQCPICKRVYSPFTHICWYCGNGEIETITSPNTEGLLQEQKRDLETK